MKRNSSHCSLNICSQRSLLSLCAVQSLLLRHRKWKERAGFGGISIEINTRRSMPHTNVRHHEAVEWRMLYTEPLPISRLNELAFGQGSSSCSSSSPTQSESGYAFLGKSRNKAQECMKQQEGGLQPPFTKMEGVCVGHISMC